MCLCVQVVVLYITSKAEVYGFFKYLQFTTFFTCCRLFWIPSVNFFFKITTMLFNLLDEIDEPSKSNGKPKL